MDETSDTLDKLRVSLAYEREAFDALEAICRRQADEIARLKAEIERLSHELYQTLLSDAKEK